MSSPETVALAVVLIGTGTGAIIDIRSRRVPNALTLSLAAVGIALAVAGVGRVGIGSALVGGVIGLLIMLPGHVLGATGAGDVKLLAAVGTLLGPMGIVWAFLYTGIAGGAIALLLALTRGRIKRTLQGVAWFVVSRGANKAEIETAAANNRFAYAPAIAIGAVLAAL